MSKIIGNGSPFHAICLNQPKLSQKFQQDGFREHLLCRSCEEQRAGYEDRACRALFRNIRSVKFSGNSAVMTGLEYKPLKLYSMFQIWMMGVSTHPFYSHVVLGPHADRLAKRLLYEDPGEPWRYGSTIAVLGGNKDDFATIFSQPEQIKVRSLLVYRFVVAGLHSFHFVSSHAPDPGYQALFLQEDGTWPIFRSGIADYPDLLEKLHQTRNHAHSIGR